MRDDRQFLALIEFESKKKRKVAKAATEYMTKFNARIETEEEGLKKLLRDLNIAS